MTTTQIMPVRAKTWTDDTQTAVERCVRYGSRNYTAAEVAAVNALRAKMNKQGTVR